MNERMVAIKRGQQIQTSFGLWTAPEDGNYLISCKILLIDEGEKAAKDE